MSETSSSSVSYGLSMGSALAMILSFTQNHSIWYAIGHGILSWFYVVYWALAY